MRFGTLLGDEMRSGKPGKPCNGNGGASVPPFFVFWCQRPAVCSSVLFLVTRFDLGNQIYCETENGDTSVSSFFFLVAFLPIYVNFRQTRRCYIVSGAQQVAPLAQLVRATDS